MTQWGLDTLFNPAKRHMDEEKRRLQATRQQVGDTSGGKRIDLESGKVRIKPAGGKDEDVDEDVDSEAAEGADEVTHAATGPAADAPKDAAATAPRAGKRAAAKKKGQELTPAQLRAAQRRGRAPR